VWARGGRVFTADCGEHLPDGDDDPMRTFVRQVMGAAAQLERGLIVKRLRGGRRAKAEAGGYAHGAPAYGQQAVKKELVGAGVRKIARRLNDEGVPSQRGRRWHPTTVARLLDDGAREAAREGAVTLTDE
jgi:DNA invertase Pin-like site-specific DNA recombinase